MKKSMFLLIAIIMIAALALSACAQPTAAPTQAVATEAPTATKLPQPPQSKLAHPFH